MKPNMHQMEKTTSSITIKTMLLKFKMSFWLYPPQVRWFKSLRLRFLILNHTSVTVCKGAPQHTLRRAGLQCSFLKKFYQKRKERKKKEGGKKKRWALYNPTDPTQINTLSFHSIRAVSFRSPWSHSVSGLTLLSTLILKKLSKEKKTKPTVICKLVKCLPFSV